MKLKTFNFWLILAAIFIPLAARAEDQIYKIGVLVCLSGECAEWGANTLKGLELARDEINSQGGVLGRSIKLVVEDTDEGKSGAHAVTAFKKIIQDPEISLLIGPSWTPAGLAIAPLASRNKAIIIMSPSLGVKEFNEAGDNIYNVWPHDNFATQALAEYSIKKGWKRAAIFSSQQPWENTQGKTFENQIIRLGGEVTAFEEPLPTLPDLKTEAAKIKNSAPQVVFLSNLNQMGNAAKRLRQTGYSGPLLAILMDETRIKSADGALEGAIFARYPDPSKKFIEKYRQKFDSRPGITADTAYDALKIYAKAIKKAKRFEVPYIKKEVNEIKHRGASGDIQFDEKGAVQKTPVLYAVMGGSMLPLKNLKR